jgi:8-oxo-dGTP pyrophosphatase MutT (NUDIX family)
MGSQCTWPVVFTIPGMSEERWRPSVTVAAVIERDGRYLLVEEMTPEGLRLNQPAGHLDPGESLLQAVVREAREETTCDFTPEALLGVHLARFERAGETITYLRFAFCGTAGEPVPGRLLDQPIVRTLWLTPAEIAERAPMHRSVLVQRCIDEHRAGLRFPLDVLRGMA